MPCISASKPLVLRISQLLLLLVSAISPANVNSQALPDFDAKNAANSNAPVAFVYVAEPNSILGYAAATDGTLTSVPGSPFSASVFGLAVNGKYLFGSEFDGVHVDAYRIQSNGSLTFATSTDINQYNNGTTCPNLQASPLVLDHTGATLYTVAYQGDVCDSTSYKSFEVDKATGGLTYLGDSGTRPVWNFPLRFNGNNEYAYGAACIGGLTTPYWADAFGVLKRSANGKLTYINAKAPLPPTKDSSYFFCRSHTAADPKDNLVVGVYQLDPIATDLFNQGSMLANYKIENSGSLTTRASTTTCRGQRRWASSRTCRCRLRASSWQWRAAMGSRCGMPTAAVRPRTTAAC
jgi:hypothetical protein